MAKRKSVYMSSYQGYTVSGISVQFPLTIVYHKFSNIRHPEIGQLGVGCTSAGSRSIIPDDSGLVQGATQLQGVGRAIFSWAPGSYFVSWLLLATKLHLLPDSGRRNAADTPCWPAGGARSQGR